MKHVIVGIVCAFLLVLIMAANPFVIIKAGYRGIVLNWGAAQAEALGEGLHWRTPIVQKVIKMDVRIQKETATATSATKDLQNVSTEVAINYSILPDRAVNIYKTVGVDYKVTLVDPALQEVVKSATAKFTAEELITKREEVKEDIKELISARMGEYGISIVALNIVNFDFSNSFNAAIEAKVTAEQNALAAKNKLEQIRFEADQRIAQATAEAEAIKIQAEAITQQGGDNYVQLQAIEKWNGILPAQFVPGSAIPFLNLK